MVSYLRNRKVTKTDASLRLGTECILFIVQTRFRTNQSVSHTWVVQPTVIKGTCEITQGKCTLGTKINRQIQLWDHVGLDGQFGPVPYTAEMPQISEHSLTEL